MSKFDVEFYEKENGEQPAKEFLLSLDVKMRAKAMHMIAFLAENCYELREPFSKALTNEILELRIKLGSDIIRIFYFFSKQRIIVLTNGFKKKTRKTPKRELEIAKKFKEDYNRREATRNE